MIPWWRTDFDEADCAAVADAVRNRHLSQGPVTREFEERLAETLGVPYVVCTTSGTTALTMALLGAGIGRGDEVIVPDRTWVATAHAVMMTGARVALVDVDQNGLLPLFHGEPSPQYIVPVHLNGRFAAVDDEAIVIEDSCQAFPKRPIGEAACYSFSTAKLIPTGQGGAVATRDEGFYRECLALRTHDVADAMVPQVLEWRRFGYNFRYTDIQAALGLRQLSQLKEKIERLQAVRKLYEGSLPESLTLLPCDGVPLYTECLHPDPKPLRAYLLSQGIQARPFYPSLHTAPYLQPPHKTAYHDYEFPNSAKFSKGLTLPSGPDQPLSDILRVIEALHGYQR